MLALNCLICIHISWFDFRITKFKCIKWVFVYKKIVYFAIKTFVLLYFSQNDFCVSLLLYLYLFYNIYNACLLNDALLLWSFVALCLLRLQIIYIFSFFRFSSFHFSLLFVKWLPASFSSPWFFIYNFCCTSFSA